MPTRYWRASFWSALGGAAAISVSLQLWRIGTGAFEGVGDVLLRLMIIFVIAFLFALPCAAIIGVPVSVLLKKVGLVYARHYAGAGALVAVGFCSAYFAYRWAWTLDGPFMISFPKEVEMIGPGKTFKNEAFPFLACIIAGPVSALCFWKGEGHAS